MRVKMLQHPGAYPSRVAEANDNKTSLTSTAPARGKPFVYPNVLGSLGGVTSPDGVAGGASRCDEAFASPAVAGSD